MQADEKNQPAEKISITLTPEMMRVIRESVAAGEFASTSEALRDAVRLWQRERAERAERLAAIKARIERSIANPEPRLTAEDMDLHLEQLFSSAERVRRSA